MTSNVGARYITEQKSALGFSSEEERLDAALEESKESDEFKQMERLSALTGVPIPGNLQGLQKKPELHTDVIPKDKMLSLVAGL